MKPGSLQAPHPALNLLLVAGGIFVGLLIAEGLTALLAPQAITPAFLLLGEESGLIYQADSLLGMTLKPSLNQTYIFGTHVLTNSQGLRDHEYAAKDPREFRILSLGDSYAFGFGVEVDQTYAKVLERELSQAFPRARFSVINAGVTDYGTRQELLTFRRLNPVLRPDFVLVTFTAGNDVSDNALFEARLRSGHRTPMGFVARHSHLARLVLHVGFPISFFLENRDEENIDYTIRLLRELEAELASAHLPYLVVVIPARHQIRPSVEPASRLLVDIGLEPLLFRQNRRVMEHFERERIPYLDLWPALAARDSVTPVSFADDSHLNEVGHEVAGHQLFLELQKVLPTLLARRSVPTRQSN